MTLLYLAIAFLAGVAVGSAAWSAGVIPCGFPAWLWVALTATLPFTPLLNRLQPEPEASAELRWPRSAGFVAPRTFPTLGLAVAVALCLTAGFTRYAAHPLTPCLDAGDLAYWNTPHDLESITPYRTATVEGAIASYPSVRDTSQSLDVRAHSLTIGGSSYAVEGTARLWTDLEQSFTYGQPVQVSGLLTEPFPGDDGSYRDYLARRDIRSQIQRASVTVLPGELGGNRLLSALYGLRARGEEAANRLLPAPYAAVASGMLLGIDGGIPRELMERFQATGTSHVLVISGSNVALIAGVLAGLFMRLLGRRRAWIPVVAGIALYALLVGGDMAVLRAALMGGLAVVALGLGRRGTGIISLGAACWVLVMINPLALWDVGFQLSAAATAGLILFTPMLAGGAARLWPGWMGGSLTSPYTGAGNMGDVRAPAILRGLLEDSVVVSLAATIAVTPLIAHTFGRVSAVGMLANLLIVPVQPLITVWGSAGVLSGALGADLPAQLLLWTAWPGLFWTVEVVERAASLPFASVAISHYEFRAMLGTYAVMGVLLWRRPLSKWLKAQAAAQRTKPRLLSVRPATLVAAGLLALLVWWAALALPDGRLHLHFLDIGQGDAILLVTPAGRQVLVDGGESPQKLLVELGAVMPFWDRSLDMVVLTHADGDHMDAQTQALRRLDVGQAITSQATLDSGNAAAWRQQLEREGVAVSVQCAGGWIDLGDGVALWVLNPAAEGYIGPDPDNENSLVVKVVYGDFSALLTGDTGLVTESDFLAAGAPIQASVLKVGHHGSRTGTGAAFVAAVDPQIAVVQVGADNDFGHPHQEVLDRLAGRTVLRNDIDGRVHVASDGRQMWLESHQRRR